MVLDLKQKITTGQILLSSRCNASSSSVPPSIFQSSPTTNLVDFVKQLIPALTDHFLPVVIERVHEVITSPSRQPDTPIDNPSVVPPATTNVDEVDPLVPNDDRSPSPLH